MSNSRNLARLPVDVGKAIESAQRPFRKIAENHHNIVQWEDESMFAMQAISGNALLQKCETYSIRDSIINVAAIGLSLNPKLQHCALIPRYNNRERRYEAHADPMYQGLLKLATDGGKVLNVSCAVVYGDEIEDKRFEYRLGSHPFLNHQPDPFKNRSGMDGAVGAYCVAEINGSQFPKIEFMRANEILDIMERSEIVKYARKNNKPLSGPWATDPGEMWKKTVLKRAQKTWPKGSGRLELGLHYANVAEGYIEPKESDIDGKAEPIKTISPEQATELRGMCRHISMPVEKVYTAFKIAKMEELPIEFFEKVKERITTAGLLNALRHAKKEDEFYANSYGLNLEQLEGLGAQVKTKARLFSKKI